MFLLVHRQEEGPQVYPVSGSMYDLHKKRNNGFVNDNIIATIPYHPS
jgi:hypothetical protein